MGDQIFSMTSESCRNTVFLCYKHLIVYITMLILENNQFYIFLRMLIINTL